MSWTRGEQIKPRYVKTEDAKHLREAEDLINVFIEHEGRTRAALEAELSEYVGTGTDYKILRGFIKLLMDRCEFETSVAIDPSEIRRALFLAAREGHPIVGDAERTALVERVAVELACEPSVILEGLYADLPENQKLTGFETLGARELLDLYNVAQAQALLYRCVQMRLWVAPQSAEGYRELFGAIKAYRLVHTIKGNARDGYEINLDGPVSIFHRSQKYGIQMAVFLPALLLCSNWRMRAEITAKFGHTAFFELTSEQTQLRSHYLSVKNYENPAIEKLSEAWARAGSAWTLEPSSVVIDLGESAFIPDYVIRHPSGRDVFLEVLGFWTPDHLRARLKEFEHARFRHFIIAAWEDLRGTRDPMTTIPPHTIVFKSKLDPVIVELMADKLVAD